MGHWSYYRRRGGKSLVLPPPPPPSIKQDLGIPHTGNNAFDGQLAVAFQVPAVPSYLLTAISMYLFKTGTQSGTWKYELWSNSAGSPGTKLSESATTNVSALPNAPGGYYKLDVPPVGLVLGVPYWFVLRGSTLANIGLWYRTVAGHNSKVTSNDVSWGLWASDREYQMQLWGS